MARTLEDKLAEFDKLAGTPKEKEGDRKRREFMEALKLQQKPDDNIGQFTNELEELGLPYQSLEGAPIEIEGEKTLPQQSLFTPPRDVRPPPEGAADKERRLYMESLAEEDTSSDNNIFTPPQDVRPKPGESKGGSILDMFGFGDKQNVSPEEVDALIAEAQAKGIGKQVVESDVPIDIDGTFTEPVEQAKAVKQEKKITKQAVTQQLKQGKQIEKQAKKVNKSIPKMRASDEPLVRKDLTPDALISDVIASMFGDDRNTLTKSGEFRGNQSNPIDVTLKAEQMIKGQKKFDTDIKQLAVSKNINNRKLALGWASVNNSLVSNLSNASVQLKQLEIAAAKGDAAGKDLTTQQLNKSIDQYDKAIKTLTGLLKESTGSDGDKIVEQIDAHTIMLNDLLEISQAKAIMGVQGR